ncbi:hypothetical protein HPB47_022720, partial [Ixodes persulcatus]
MLRYTNVQVLSEQMFYEYYNVLLLPAVNKVWRHHHPFWANLAGAAIAGTALYSTTDW